MSPYEQDALHEIEVWKSRDLGWVGKVTGAASRTLGSVVGASRKVPGVSVVLDDVIGGLLRVVSDTSQGTVKPEAALKAYRKAGHEVETLADLHALDLADVDRQLKGLGRFYGGAGAVEGAITGAAGAVGVAADVVALVALCLRACAEHAVRCGFDPQDPQERLYAVQLLNAASHPDGLRHDTALAPLRRAAERMVRDQVVRAVEEVALRRALQNAARALGMRLTSAKLAQALPIAGAAVGAGFNAYYTSKVCDAAFFLYRERFLERKRAALPPSAEA